jgi:serine/threonine protein kinase/Flp pilus assembly protein TadD
MTEVSLPTDSSLESLVAGAVDEFRDRQKRGEQPEPEEYAARYPAAAGVLRKVLASLQLLDQSWAGDAAAPGERPVGVLGDFQILREIGRGGMGVVYEAVQISLGRRVALKVLPLAAALDAKQLQRFKNEAQAAAHLHHTNIVPVHAVGCERNVHFYAMQFIEGQTLAAVIRDLRRHEGREDEAAARPGSLASAPERQLGPAAEDLSDIAKELLSGRLAPPKPAPIDPHATAAYTPPDQLPLTTHHSPLTTHPSTAAALSTDHSIKTSAYFRTVANLGVQAAQALEHAHQLGVTHRDIKPANLLLDVRGTLWVTDFGLAQIRGGDAALTMSGDLLGTIRYMSPEQALAKRVAVDERTDVYSLGVTLYELLTLEPAFSGKDRQEVLRQIAFDEPKLPTRINKTIPAELETIVLKAMEKNPAERYATAQELADDLERYLEDKPIRARRPSVLLRAKKWARRHPGATGTAAVALVVLVLGLAVSNVMIAREKSQKDVALGEKDAALVRATEEEQLARRALGRARRAVDRMYMEVAQKWLAAGVQPLQREFLADAVSFYQEFAKEQSSDPEARLQAALAYTRVALIQNKMGELAKAENACNQGIALLEKLVAEFPSEPRYREALAEGLGGRGSLLIQLGGPSEGVKAYRQAVQLVRKLVAEYPDAPAYRRQLAYQVQGLADTFPHGGLDPREAEEAYREDIELFKNLPGDPASTPDCRRRACFVTVSLAELLVQNGREKEGEEWLHRGVTLSEELVADFPYEPDYQANLAEYLVSWAGRLKEPKEVEKALRRAVDLQEKVLAHSPIGAWNQSLTGSCYGALEEFLKSAKRPQEVVEIYYRAIELHEKLAVKCPTVAYYRNALVDYRNNLASLLRSLGRVEEAEKVYQQAVSFWEKLLEANPGAAAAYGGRGAAYAALGQREKAAADLAKAIELQPNEPAPRCWRAEFYGRRGDWASAAEDFAKASGLSPEQVEFQYWHALARVGAGDLAGHRCACAAMLDRFGSTDNADAAHWVAWTSVLVPNGLKDWDRLVRLAETALRSDPKSEAYSNTLGATLYRAGRLGEAIKQLNEVVGNTKPGRISPAYPWFFLAMANQRSGHPEEARQWLDKATKWMEQETQKSDILWNRRLTLQLFRREAEELVKGSGADQEKAKEKEKAHAKAPSR